MQRLSHPDATHRKRMGIYYTPERLAAILTAWAVRGPADLVLDPSCGGCVFLKTAADRLSSLGSQESGLQVVGVDRDADALAAAARSIASIGTDQLIEADFLSLRPSTLYDAVVGNPPYVRHHRLSSHELATAREAMGIDGHAVSGQASYWAYFVLHSIHFLREGGRMGMVLPMSILQSSYSTSIRADLCRSFTSVTVIALAERVFDDTDEACVVLLAEGRGEGNTHVNVLTADTVQDLEDLLGHQVPHLQVASAQGNSSGFQRLGDLAEIRIGLVTGANSYFVRSSQEWRGLGIDSKSSCVRIVSRRKHVDTIDLSTEHLNGLDAAGTKTWLLRTSEAEGHQPAAVRDYLGAGRRAGISDRRKCRERKHGWYDLPHLPVPDAFMLYFGSDGPRLTLNTAGVECTNSLYSLVWREGMSGYAKAAVLGVLSSYSQLFAERLGRTYGGGALKLEPHAAASLELPLLPPHVVAQLWPVAMRLVHAGDWLAASAVVDQRLVDADVINAATVQRIQRELVACRTRRHGSRETAIAV
jgi:adenine-specific DNA methylase